MYRLRGYTMNTADETAQKVQKVTKLDRNNTDFPVELFEALKKLRVGEHPKYAFLKYWQDLCRLFVTELDVGSRGLLIQHPMGFGKSILAVALAIEFLDQGNVMMILAKSLQGNMRDQIKKYVKLRGEHDEEFAPGKLSQDELDVWIAEHFAFVSLNAGNMMSQVAARVESQSELDKVLDARLGRIVGDKGAPNLNGRTIIVDEAHHLFRMISNGSKNGLAFYDAVKKSTAKIFFLTGTPIASDPFEVVPCFNMLSGLQYPLFPETYEEFNRLFVDAATKRLINKGKYQNRIMGLITSISLDSEIGVGLNPDLGKVAADLRGRFPAEFPCVVRRVHMTQEQYVIYQLAREKEAEESKKTKGDRGFGFKKDADAPRQPSARMTKPKSFAASTYKVRSRQYSNFCPVNQLKEKDPSLIDDPTSSKFAAMYQDIANHAGQLGIVYSQFIGVGGLGIFAKYLESKGWSAANKLASYEEEDVEAASEKSAAANNVQSVQSTQEVKIEQPEHDYSFDVATDEQSDARPTTSGGDLLYPSLDDYLSHLGEDSWVSQPIVGASMNRAGGCECGCGDQDCQCECKGRTPCVCGVNCTCKCALSCESRKGGNADITPGLYSKKFALLTGAVDIKEREKIIATFTSVDNAHGELIALLLVSATGAEGLDLKFLRFILMMEPYWVWNRYAQLFARGPRIDSHSLLPPDERNCQPYLYLSIPPESEQSKIDGQAVYVETTDTELYKEALVNKDAVASFTDANREVSIECMANGGQCRVCAPTDTVLFTDDPDADIKRPDPCAKYQSMNIKAQEITVDGVQYYYIASKGPLGYDVFAFDSKLGNHKKIPENSAEYEAVVKRIDPSLFELF